MNKLAKRAWFTMVLAGALLLGMGVIVVRYFISADDWVTFQSSPHVYSNGVLNSGVVTDRSGTVVLDATNGRSYAESATLRRSMLHLLGDTDGYIASYLLDEYGGMLIGFDRLNGTYNASGNGGEMTLTISGEVQKIALDALGSYKGTVGVYNYKTGEILCMVSSPTYDPSDPPSYSEIEGNSAYDGVYVNRFLHATFSPGSTFKLVTAAAALENIPDITSRTFYCSGSYELAGETVICNGIHGEVDLEDALAHSCNVAFALIADELGGDVLTQYAEQIGINSRIEFDGFDTSRGSFDVSGASRYETAWAGVGQYTDLINPCQFMTYMGAIANGGTAAVPYLVEEVRFGRSVKYSADREMGARVLDNSTARELAEMMHAAVVNTYGEWNFAGVYAGAKSGTAERGEGQTANALLTGFLQDDDYPLAFVVIIEGGGGGSTACTPVISRVLNACVAAMDID